MKIARTDNAIRNSIFGLLYKVQSVLLPFLIRTVMIYIMGSEYVGLGSLFTSILSFLSLAELGVGSALVFSMYKPIAQDDDDTVCALLGLYRTIYRVIGCVILGAGLILMPFLNHLVSDGYPADLNIYILYGVYLFNTVASYLMFGYQQSLLTAFQRSDIISKRSMILQIMQNVIQFTVLLLTRNYYLYIIFLPIFTVVTNVANAIVVKKLFPKYTCRGKVSPELKKSIRKKVFALIGTKANSKVMHASGNIVLSTFLGLSVVGYYGNYFYIMDSIIGIMTVIYSSLTAGLGNSLETETKEKNYGDFKVLTFLNMWMVTFCSASFLCLYQPFMDLWVGQEAMFGFDTVILFVIYFFVYQMRRIVLTYKDAGGIWWEDRVRPYVMMVINLAISLSLVHFIGVNAVILAGIVSMLVSVPWENATIFRHLFVRSARTYYWEQLRYVSMAVLICVITHFSCCFLPLGWLGLFIRACICVALPNALFLLMTYKMPEFQKSVAILKAKFLKKLKKKG